MKISVVSALHGQTGNSTVALFVAHALVLSQKQSVCLTHGDFGSSVLFNATGVEATTDVTRSLSYVAKMLQNNMLSPEELPDYAMRVFDGLDLYSTDKLKMDMDELLKFYNFLLTKMTAYNQVVIDVDAGYSSEVSKLAISISDVVIIPVTHNQEVIEASKSMRERVIKTISKARKKKEAKIFYLLNHYNPNIASYKKVANALGVRGQTLMTLHYNPELIVGSNRGKISDTFADAVVGKPKMLDVRSDMRTMCRILFGKDFVWDVQKGGR